MRTASMRELVTYFLRLGTFGFGGPIALVGYMQKDLVDQSTAEGEVASSLRAISCKPGAAHLGCTRCGHAGNARHTFPVLCESRSLRLRQRARHCSVSLRRSRRTISLAQREAVCRCRRSGHDHARTDRDHRRIFRIPGGWFTWSDNSGVRGLRAAVLLRAAVGALLSALRLQSPGESLCKGSDCRSGWRNRGRCIHPRAALTHRCDYCPDRRGDVCHTHTDKEDSRACADRGGGSHRPLFPLKPSMSLLTLAQVRATAVGVNSNFHGLWISLLLVAYLIFSSTLLSQGMGSQQQVSPDTTVHRQPRTHLATRVDRAPKLDGTLDDPLWQEATPITNFLQREPYEGQPPTERTEVRVLYTKH